MREKKSIKRAFALLLAAVLAFTTFSSDITAIAADKPASQKLSVSTETKDGIGLTKSVVVNGDNTIDVTFKVDGSNSTQYINQTANTDIVLVLDTSRSMAGDYKNGKYDEGNKTKIYKAKNAAKSFVEQVFATEGVTNENVRIGVVSFWKDAQVVSGLTNKANKQNLINKIDAVKTNDSTNIQAGIRSARELFGADNDNKKIIVVMSDGEANYAFKSSDQEGSTEYNFNTTGGKFTIHNFSSASTYQKVEIKQTTVYRNSNNKKFYFKRTKHGYGYGSYYTYSDDDLVPAAYNNGTYCYAKGYDYVTNTIVLSDGTTKYIPSSQVYSDDYVYCSYEAAYGFNIREAAVMEAQLAKNEGAKIYSIKYDTNANDALFALKNIASLNEETNQPLFYESAVDSISNIFASIAESVAQDIAAAKGTTVVDKLPSYMSFAKDTSGKYAISTSNNASSRDASVDGKDLTWDLSNYDLKKDNSYTLTVRCAIDMDEMIKDYARKHNNMSEEAVRKLMSEEKISFELNKEVVLNYTDVSNNEVHNTDLKATADISTTTVPYTTFKTYEYDVNYVVDGTAIDTQDVHYGYKDEVINYTDAILNTEVTDAYPETSYSYEVDKESITVSDTKKEAFTVKITSKNATVTFVSETKDGVVTVDTQTVKVGTAAIDPFATAATKASYEALYNEKMSANEETAAFNYTFSNWATDGKNESLSNITKDGTFTAQYANKTKKTFTVTFDTSAANGAEWAKAVPAATGVEYGNTVTEPVDVIDVEKLPEDVASYSVTWKLGDAEFDFDTKIKSNITLVAEYTPNYKYYTVEFYGWDGNSFATVENVKHGEVISNFSTYALDRDVQTEYVKIFKGWKAASDLSGDYVTANTTVKGNLQLYPDYTQVSNQYTVTWKFLANNATQTSKTATATYEGTASVPSDVNLDSFWFEGTTYTFDHWTATDNDGSSYVIDGKSATVTSAVSNVTFEAVYSTEVDVYKFTFYYKDASGNDAEPVVREAHYGDSVTPPETPDYEVYDDNGDLVGKVNQDGWSNTDYLSVKQDGSATAEQTTTNFYVIEFVDSITGSSLWRGSVESGETPVAPEYTTESINGNVKVEATGWDSEITAATENKTYRTVTKTSYWCETVHKIGEIEIEDRYNGAWVEAGTDYTSYDSFENNYPYVTSDAKKYDKVDGSLSLTASGSNDLVVISLTECPKGTIAFYNYDGAPLNSFTGYIGDAFNGTIPTVVKPKNTFTTVYSVDTWFSATENGTKLSTDSLVYATDVQNLFAVKNEAARTFTLDFFNEDGTVVSNTVDGLANKGAVVSAHNSAKAPTKDPTPTTIYNGYWGGIYTVVDGKTTRVSIDNWDYVNDDSTTVDFGTKAHFREETRKYRVDFYMYKNDSLPMHTDWVVYEGTASGPYDLEVYFRLKSGDQFTGWDKDLGPITAPTKIYAKTLKKHTITYKNYTGATLYEEAYPKFGKTSFDTTLLTAKEVGARKSFAWTYSYKFEGWKLDADVLKEGDTVSLADGNVVVTAKFEDYIPGNFFVRLPWLGFPSNYFGHDSVEYSKGISITRDNFDYNTYYAGEFSKWGVYKDDAVANVVNLETAPTYDDFTAIDSDLPNLTEQNIATTINWYVAKIQNDGVHIDGYPTYTHDTVDLTAVYDGTNLVEALYSQLLDKADGVMVSYDDFVEAFGSEIINKTDVTALSSNWL